jgi:Flp pilus assembly CpaE family ATPase
MEELVQVVLGVVPPALASEVMDHIDRSGAARVVGAAADPAALAREVDRLEPDAVVALPRFLASAGPLGTSALLALDTDETVGSLRAAMRAGAAGFYRWPDQRGELVPATQRLRRARSRPAVRRAMTVAVIGSRGGAGVTFVSTHLAAALARDRLETTLVDADPASSEVATAIGAPRDPAPRSVVDLVPVADELGPTHLEEVLWRHPDGFGVLLGPEEASAAGRVEPGHYRGILGRTAEGAEAVVIHAGRAIAGRLDPAVELADRVLLVLTLDVLSFRGARRVLDALAGDGGTSRPALVVNRASRGQIVPADVSRVFGESPFAVIPSDRTVGPAQDRGRLLPPRSRAARAVAGMAGRLAEEAGLPMPGRRPKRPLRARGSLDGGDGKRTIPVNHEVGS